MNKIDITKMKANPKKNLVKCPGCGRVGELRKYTDGSSAILHTGVIELGFLDIKDHCFFKKELKKLKEAR